MFRMKPVGPPEGLKLLCASRRYDLAWVNMAAAPKFCSNCGLAVSGGNFCSGCGFNLKGAAALAIPKPDPDGEGAAGKGAAGTDLAEILTIKITDQASESTIFKVKRSSLFRKVFEAYAKKKGIQRENLRFLLDGTRIREEWTVGDSRLDLENEVDDDSEDGIPEIHVVLEQHGGSSFTGDVH